MDSTIYDAEKILDIGCGTSKVCGAVGIDFNAYPGVDVVHDLNSFPYPFDDGEFDEVCIRDTLFLLRDPVKVMEEIYRVLKRGGRRSCGSTILQVGLELC